MIAKLRRWLPCEFDMRQTGQQTRMIVELPQPKQTVSAGDPPRQQQDLVLNPTGLDLEGTFFNDQHTEAPPPI